MLRYLPFVVVLPVAACSVDLGDFEPFEFPDGGDPGSSSSSSSGGASSSSSGGTSSGSSSSSGGDVRDAAADATDAGLDPATVAAITAQSTVDKANRCLGGSYGADDLTTFTAQNLAYFNEPRITQAQIAASLACAQSQGDSCLGNTPECLTAGKVPGSLENGAGCLDDGQCGSGVCDRNSIACGTCIAALGAQAACAGPADSRCGLGLLCVGDEGNAICTEQVTLSENAECTYFADTCGANLACTHTQEGDRCLRAIAPGATCMLGSVSCDQGGAYQCSAGSCQARPGVGDHCDSTPECHSGLVCDDAACRAPKVDLPVDAICTQSDRCVAGASCSRYEQSTFSQYCTLDAAQGQPCGNTVGGCASGLSCSEETHVCEPTPAPQTCP